MDSTEREFKVITNGLKGFADNLQVVLGDSYTPPAPDPLWLRALLAIADWVTFILGMLLAVALGVGVVIAFSVAARFGWNLLGS